jgi:hypothetical protein
MFMTLYSLYSDCDILLLFEIVFVVFNYYCFEGHGEV